MTTVTWKSGPTQAPLPPIMLTVATMLHSDRFEMDPPGYELKIRPLPTNAPADNFRLRRVR